MHSPTLRPLSVADMVDEIFRLYRRHLGLLFGLSALIWLPASVLMTVGLVIMGPLGGATGLSANVALGLAVILVGALVGIVALPLLLGGITEAIARTYLGQPATIDSAFRRAVRTYWRLIGAYLLVFIAIAVAVLAVVLVGALLAGVLGGPLAVVVIIVTFVATIAAAIWMAATWSLVAQAVVVEDAGVRAALARSALLTSGSRWRVVGINVLLGLLGAVLFTIPASTIGLLLAPLPLPETLTNALAQVVGAFAQTAYYPVQLGTLTLLYFDLRVRREGFDLTLAAERLPTA